MSQTHQEDTTARSGDIGAPDMRPCPFCGNPDVDLAQMPLRKGWLTVQCGRCESSGPWRTEEAAAIASWNARTDATLLRALANLADTFHEGRATYAESDAGYVLSRVEQAEAAIVESKGMPF